MKMLCAFQTEIFFDPHSFSITQNKCPQYLNKFYSLISFNFKAHLKRVVNYNI